MARRGAGKTLAVPINIQIAGTLFPNLPQLGSKEIQDNRAVGDSRPKGSLLSPVEHSPIDQVDNPVPYAVAGRDNAPLGAYKFFKYSKPSCQSTSSGFTTNPRLSSRSRRSSESPLER